uniref:Reverse transcriptase zinc-binding domain-containing protein n=1 Tax=Rhodnius prolixus TaxID=13249 RepID=T1I198_RHOPR
MQNSRWHSIYKELSFDFGPNHYITDTNSLFFIQNIIKIRGSLFNLNYRVGRSEEAQICSLCNLHELEDIFHYIAVCPILTEFRK